jgi:hypothetical protein
MLGIPLTTVGILISYLVEDKMLTSRRLEQLSIGSALLLRYGQGHPPPHPSLPSICGFIVAASVITIILGLILPSFRAFRFSRWFFFALLFVLWLGAAFVAAPEMKYKRTYERQYCEG